MKSGFLIGLVVLMSLSIDSFAEESKKLNKEIIKSLQYSVYEVVVPKIEDENIIYEKPLPFDTLPFKERTDKFLSIGTAFFISDKEVVSAAHVFNIPNYSLYTKYFLRDEKGELFEVNQVKKYSMHKDIIMFDLKSYPEKVTPLKLKTESEIGDTVFTVGNAQGEGISFREGQVASYTSEVLEGQWKDIRFSSPASPGNSGGPLITNDGKVIGVIVKKNTTENYNYAVPVNLIETLSNKKADFIMKSQGVMLFYKENSILKDWKIELDLPDSFDNLRNLSQDSFEKFMDKGGNEVYAKYENVYAPLGKAFNDYVRDPILVKGLGTLSTDQNFTKWGLNTYEMQTINITSDQKIYIGKSHVANLTSIIEKPKDIPLKEFLSNQKLFMDELLKALSFGRVFGSQNITVRSLGKPYETKRWKDSLSRPWVTSRWSLPWMDSYLATSCLPYPKGAVCNIEIKQNMFLRRGDVKNFKLSLDELTLGYEGSIKDWKEYFELPKEYLPEALQEVQISSVENTFKMKAGEYSMNFKNKDITEHSEVHFHMAYKANKKWNEEIALFEIFPIAGNANYSFRVHRMIEASETNENKYKNTWLELKNQAGVYSGKPVQEENFLKIRYKAKEKDRKIAAENPDSIFVTGCNFISSKDKDEATADCLKFKSAIQF